MRKKLLITLALCLAFAAAKGQDDKAPVYSMTLQDCLQFATQNSFTRQSTALSAESKELGYEQSKQERLPNLNASVSENVSHSNGQSASFGGSYGVSTGVTLYNGGSINNTIEQSKLQSEQAVYQLAQYDNELAIQIIETFLSALGNEDLLKYQRAVLKTSEEQVRRGNVLLENGEILESDKLMFDAQYATDQNNITNTEITRDNNLRTLKSLLSLDPLTELTVVAPDTAALIQMGMIPSQDFVIERGMETLPEIAISEYNVDIAKTSLNLSKSGYYPTVSLSGSMGTGHSKDFNDFGGQLSDRFNQQAGISVSIPIFSKGRNKTQVAQSKISLQQAELSQMQTQLNTRQTLVEQYQNLIGARSKYEASAISENAYGKSYAASYAQFEEGVMTPVELLQQQNNYINAINNFVQSKYTYFLRRKVLDVYMGFEVKL